MNRGPGLPCLLPLEPSAPVLWLRPVMAVYNPRKHRSESSYFG